MNIPRVLVISALDPSGGAGLLMDIRAITRAGAVGVVAVSALTVQGPKGVRAVHPVSDEILASQIQTLVDELPIRAVKIGALGSPENVRAVSAFLHAYPTLPVVLDPVLKPTHGVDLLPQEALVELRKGLLDKVTIVTPNRDEAQVLTGIEIKGVKDMRKASKALLEVMGEGERWVLIKGGHLPGEPVDLLMGAKQSKVFRGRRKPGEYRGTGCALASAISAGLAQGLDVPRAVAKARRLLMKWMDRAIPSVGAKQLIT